MRNDILCYLRWSGWVPQSVDRVLPDLGRWEARLRARGVHEIPLWGRPSTASPCEAAKAHNELNLLMLQARDDHGALPAHELRNLTGVRPFKP